MCPDRGDGLRFSFTFFFSEVSLLLFLYLTFLKHETQTEKSLTEYSHSPRDSSWEGGACLEGLLLLWSLLGRPFTRMILMRLTGVGAKSLRIRTQKRKVSGDAGENLERHSCLSCRINGIDADGDLYGKGAKQWVEMKNKTEFQPGRAEFISQNPKPAAGGEGIWKHEHR